MALTLKETLEVIGSVVFIMTVLAISGIVGSQLWGYAHGKRTSVVGCLFFVGLCVAGCVLLLGVLALINWLTGGACSYDARTGVSTC